MKIRLLDIAVTVLIVNFVYTMNQDVQKMSDAAQSLELEIVAFYTKSKNFNYEEYWLSINNLFSSFSKYKHCYGWKNQVDIIENQVLVEWPKKFQNGIQFKNTYCKDMERYAIELGIVAFVCCGLGYSDYTKGTTFMDSMIKKGISYVGGIATGILACINLKESVGALEEAEALRNNLARCEVSKTRLASLFASLKALPTK